MEREVDLRIGIRTRKEIRMNREGKIMILFGTKEICKKDVKIWSKIYGIGIKKINVISVRKGDKLEKKFYVRIINGRK